jgi:hypothetical protein
MVLRLSSELIQSLRVTLQKIEENFASPEDESNIAELKRILCLASVLLRSIEASDLEMRLAALESVLGTGPAKEKSKG